MLMIKKQLVETSSREKDINEECVVDRSTMRGTCQPDIECQYFLNLRSDQIMRFGYQNRCSFEGDRQIICCPTTETKSAKACSELPEKPSLPLTTTDYILDGEAASVSEFPYNVALGYALDGIIEWNCGGVLISKKFVLTAAHCFKKSLRVVRLGKTSLNMSDPRDRTIGFDIPVKVKPVF